MLKPRAKFRPDGRHLIKKQKKPDGRHLLKWRQNSNVLDISTLTGIINWTLAAFALNPGYFSLARFELTSDVIYKKIVLIERKL